MGSIRPNRRPTHTGARLQKTSRRVVPVKPPHASILPYSDDGIGQRPTPHPSSSRGFPGIHLQSMSRCRRPTRPRSARERLPLTASCALRCFFARLLPEASAPPSSADSPMISGQFVLSSSFIGGVCWPTAFSSVGVVGGIGVRNLLFFSLLLHFIFKQKKEDNLVPGGLFVGIFIHLFGKKNKHKRQKKPQAWSALPTGHSRTQVTLPPRVRSCFSRVNPPSCCFFFVFSVFLLTRCPASAWSAPRARLADGFCVMRLSRTTHALSLRFIPSLYFGRLFPCTDFGGPCTLFLSRVSDGAKQGNYTSQHRTCTSRRVWQGRRRWMWRLGKTAALCRR